MQPNCNGDGWRLRIDIDFGGTLDTLMCWLWATSSYVQLFRCTFEFGCIVACLATMIAIAHSIAHPWAIYIYTCNYIHFNGDGSRPRIDIDFGGKHDTLLCWLWTNSTYVYLYSNLDVLLLVWLRWLQLHTRVAAIYTTYMQPNTNGDGSRIRIEIDFGGIYDTLLCWLWTNRRFAYVYLF